MLFIMINFKSYTNDGAKIVVFHELYKKMADYLWLCPNTAHLSCIFAAKIGYNKTKEK